MLSFSKFSNLFSLIFMLISKNKISSFSNLRFSLSLSLLFRLLPHFLSISTSYSLNYPFLSIRCTSSVYIIDLLLSACTNFLLLCCLPAHSPFCSYHLSAYPAFFSHQKFMILSHGCRIFRRMSTSMCCRIPNSC
jgi:hypothetical protein